MLEDWHYIILLGAVILVAAYALPRSKKNAQQPPVPAQSIKNMETALEQFMENMERDNEELADLVLKAQKDAKAEALRKEQRVEELSMLLKHATERIAQLESQQALGAKAAGDMRASEQAYADQVIEQQTKQEASDTIRSRYAELFELYDQGKSIDAICKKLGLHKGEVQLIMGLAKQEESVYVK